MNYQTSQSKGDRFMKGWQTLFSKSQQTGKKPFPKDRFSRQRNWSSWIQLKASSHCWRNGLYSLVSGPGISLKRPISPK